MNKRCRECGCLLNSENAAKKDRFRYRLVCKPCHKINRRNRRIEKREEKLMNFINQRILKINFDPIPSTFIDYVKQKMHHIWDSFKNLNWKD
jgi:NMD protein affecting ribosome stability and mRNA decay